VDNFGNQEKNEADVFYQDRYFDACVDFFRDNDRTRACHFFGKRNFQNRAFLFGHRVIHLYFRLYFGKRAGKVKKGSAILK
jgi:hypothetical protein